SAFAPSAPSTTRSFFGQPPPASTAGAKEKSGKPDFAAARKRALYKPGATQYDELLPPNYMELLPKTALEAFRAERDAFEWGNIPEWIPPKELR
ncbi:hypothetical protein OH77DRAFT_1403224, partial [Trametes cingulata]